MYKLYYSTIALYHPLFLSRTAPPRANRDTDYRDRRDFKASSPREGSLLNRVTDEESDIPTVNVRYYLQ